jgi:hypothetical protein
MAKFLVVNEAPATLEKGEIVIQEPNFLDQIVANNKKAPRSKQTAVNHLREILQTVSSKYDPELNAMRVKLVNYTGLPFADDQELSKIVTRILKTEHPSTFEKVLDFDIAHRPPNTKLIYFVGNFANTAAFFRAGIDQIDEKDVESYMTGKPKKTVGKPAITNEEAKERGGTSN